MQQINCTQKVLNCLHGKRRNSTGYKVLRRELVARLILHEFGTQVIKLPQILNFRYILYFIYRRNFTTRTSAKMGCWWMRLFFFPLYLMLYSYIVLKKIFLKFLVCGCLAWPPFHGRALKTAKLCPKCVQWSLCKVINSPAIPLPQKVASLISASLSYY